MMCRLVQGDLCGILSQLLRRSLSSKLIFEKEIREKLNNLLKWVGSGTKSIRNDLSIGKMIFSEESSRAIHEMGNMELIELRQTSAIVQCPSCLKHVPEGLNRCQCGVWLRPNQSTMDRVRTAFAAFKTPDYSASVIISRGKKVVTTHGNKIIKKPWMQEEGNETTRIHLCAGPMPEPRNIQSFSIDARLD